MIGRLTGTLCQNGNDIIVDVGGVGYTVCVSEKTKQALLSEGQVSDGRQVTLEIATCVKEDAIELVGFIGATEKQLFHLFKGVSGIGTRTALAILSFFSPDEIAHAISTNDTAEIQRIPGVGRKTAERLIIELRDKIAKLSLSHAHREAGKPDYQMTQEALSALVNLGYTRLAAEKAVTHAYTRDCKSVEELIRKSLKAISPS